MPISEDANCRLPLSIYRNNHLGPMMMWLKMINRIQIAHHPGDGVADRWWMGIRKGPVASDSEK